MNWTELLLNLATGALAAIAWCYTLLALAPIPQDEQHAKGITGAAMISAACVGIIAAWYV